MKTVFYHNAWKHLKWTLLSTKLPENIRYEHCFLPSCMKTSCMNIVFYHVAWKHSTWTLFSTKLHENILHEHCFLKCCLKTFRMNIVFYQVAWKHPIWALFFFQVAWKHSAWALFSTKLHENIPYEHSFLPSCIFLREKIEALLSTELNPGWWCGLVGQNVGSVR